MASCMVHRDALAEVLATGIIGGDFFSDRNRWLFEAAAALYRRNEPVTQISVAAVLAADGRLVACGGHALLSRLVADLPTTVGVGYAAQIVQRQAVYRRMVDAAGAIARLGYAAGADVDGAVGQAIALVQGVARRLPEKRSWREQVLVDVLTEVSDFADAKGAVLGLPTPWPLLNRITLGLRPGELWYVGATTSTGKTALMANAALHLLRRQVPVLYVSLEQTDVELAHRILAQESGYSISSTPAWQREAAVEAMMTAGNALAPLPFHPLRLGRATIETLGGIAQVARQQDGIGLLVVDHVQLLHGEGRDRYEQVSAISRGLKNLALDLNIPELAAAQLSRKVAERHPPVPVLSDLRDSGSLEQDADVVLLLYPDPAVKQQAEAATVAFLRAQVAKSRNTGRGSFRLRFNKASQRMEEWTPKEETG